MTGHGAKLSPKKEAAILALLKQRNVEEAARVAGISAKTLRRWQQQPEFQAAYRKANREVFGQAVARLQQSTGAAVTTLLKVMLDIHTPAAIKARVAEAILAHAFKGTEMDDFAASLAELEQAVYGS